MIKKKFLFLVSLLLTGSLVACGGNGGGDASGSANNSSGGGNGGDEINLPNTVEQAKNKFLQLALTQGFEITFKSEGAEASDGTDQMTVGYKSDVLWVKESAAYKKVDTKIEMYEYVTASRSYEFQAEIAESAQFSMNDTLTQLTAAFYIGYELANAKQVGYIASEKSTTFNGRAATEYTYSYRGLEGSADVKLVFDNETGITLKVSGSAATADGSFSSGTYEVTSFKTGSAVVPPTLNKNSGGQQGGEGGGQQGGEGGGQQGGGQQGGGQGEQGEVSKFENKEFVYDSNQNYNIFVGSKLCLFQDGSFELSFTDGGALVVYLGNYTVNEAGTLAYLTPVKVYKAKANQYSNLTEATMWNFRYDSDDAYVLLVNASSSVTYKVTNNQPMRADIPDDPNGGAGQNDEKFIVTQAQWEALLKGNMVNMNSNFTARVPYKYDTTGSMYTTYEFDSGKVHVITASSGYTSEQYFQFTSNESGYSYYKDNYDAWQSQQSPLYLDSFNGDMGLLPVPFSSVSYSSELHCYSCSSWKDENQDTYSAIRFYFENGNLIKMTYNHWSTNYQHEFSKYGSTSVTIPQVGGGNHPTQDQLDALVSNNVYVYNSALDMDEKYTATQLNGFFAGNKASFFADKSFEIAKNRLVNYQTGVVSEHVYVAIGEYKVEEATASRPDDNYIVLNIKKLVVDGVLEQDNINQSVRIRVTPKEDKVTILEDDYNAEIYTYYKKDASLTPTHVQYTEKPDNPPQPESKWPAEDIATKLTRLGFGVTIPAPSADNDANISSVAANVADDNSSLTIIVTANSSNNAAFIFRDFTYAFNTAFTPDSDQSVVTNERMSYIYYNASKDVTINLIYEIGSSVVTIVISRYTAPVDPFPAEDIAAFFRSNEINASFPDLTMDNVSFSFVSYGPAGFLTMTPVGDNTTTAILSAVEALLFRAGLKVFYAPDETGAFATLYMNGDMQYYVMFYEQEGSISLMISVLSEDMKGMFSTSYPEKFLRDAIPAGVRDPLPSLAVEGATYVFGEGYEGYDLLISMQSGMSADRSLRTLKATLVAAGYTPNDDETLYVSAKEQIAISLEVIDNKVIYVGIQVMYEEQDVEYTFIFDDGWDFDNDDAQIYVYVWDSEDNHEWIPVDYDKDSHSFTVQMSDRWIGCKVVRFADYSEIGWEAGPDGSVNEGVKIWNQTGDIELSGETGEIHFSVK